MKCCSDSCHIRFSLSGYFSDGKTSQPLQSSMLSQAKDCAAHFSQTDGLECMRKLTAKSLLQVHVYRLQLRRYTFQFACAQTTSGFLVNVPLVSISAEIKLNNDIIDIVTTIGHSSRSSKFLCGLLSANGCCLTGEKETRSLVGIQGSVFCFTRSDQITLLFCQKAR